MTEQLRPVDGRQDDAPEVCLLKQVAEIVRQAQVEFRGGFATAGRLEISAAQRLLDRAYRGEVGS
jgi:hypothetical protein